MEDITEMEQGQQEQLPVNQTKRKLLIEIEKGRAEIIRERAMERMGEIRARENVERILKGEDVGVEQLNT